MVAVFFMGGNFVGDYCGCHGEEGSIEGRDTDGFLGSTQLSVWVNGGGVWIEWLQMIRMVELVGV